MDNVLDRQHVALLLSALPPQTLHLGACVIGVCEPAARCEEGVPAVREGVGFYANRGH